MIIIIKVMARLLFSLVIVTAAVAAPATPSEPRKCCVDKQFSAVLGDIGAVGASGNALYFLDGTTSIAYDFYQQKSKTHTRMKNPDGSALIRDELKDYANRIVYTTDENGNCTIGPLKPYDFMFDGCIPDDAVYLGPAAFGHGVYSLAVHTWSFLLPGNGTDRWEAVFSLTQQHCVPVIETLFGQLDGAFFEESLLYTGYRPGIEADVSLVPPPNCRGSPMDTPNPSILKFISFRSRTCPTSEKIMTSLLLTGIASGQQPAKCCFDKEYAVNIGIVGETLPEDPNDVFFIDGFVRMGFDYYRDRQALMTVLKQPDGSMSTRYQLKDYANRRLYTTVDNKTCTYSDIASFDVLRPQCIPDNATFVGASEFGYGHNSLRVNTWQFTYPLSANNNSGIILTVTQDHCVPVTESIIGSIEGIPIEESLFFTNYHPGIQDLRTLEIPDNCQPAPQKCCFDKQFSVTIGTVGEVLADDPDSAYFIDGTVELGYDYYRDREGLIIHMTQINGTVTTQYQLKDYAARRVYTSFDNVTCQYFDLPDFDVMREPCIPVLGYGHQTMRVNTWQFTRAFTSLNDSTVILTVTQDHCVPVTETVIGPFGLNPTPVEQSLFFVDYHPGLENLNSLEPPAGCQPVSRA
ncbi:uncharacterized protein LOC143293575 [Babylonia areolata]|uniref:uncharacterized protein LOC143293575 n=1 Tax=Babylonia areolata TaxID=304850 RepID=UPI003FD6A81A